MKISNLYQYLTSGICSEKRKEDETSRGAGSQTSIAALCNAFRATWSWRAVLSSSVTCFTSSRFGFCSQFECRQASVSATCQVTVQWRAFWEEDKVNEELRVNVTEQRQEIRSRNGKQSEGFWTLLLEFCSIHRIYCPFFLLLSQKQIAIGSKYL